MRLVLACVLGSLVVAAAAALSSYGFAGPSAGKGRSERSGSLIVALGG